MIYTPSPDTSQFASPTFSWADSSGDDAMSEMNLDTRQETAGSTYDAEAAKAQLKKRLSRLAQSQEAEEDDDAMDEADEAE